LRTAKAAAKAYNKRKRAFRQTEQRQYRAATGTLSDAVIGGSQGKKCPPLLAVLLS